MGSYGPDQMKINSSIWIALIKGITTEIDGVAISYFMNDITFVIYNMHSYS